MVVDATRSSVSNEQAYQAAHGLHFHLVAFLPLHIDTRFYPKEGGRIMDTYKNPELASHRNNFIRCMKDGNSCRHAGEYDQALKHFSEARHYAYKLLPVRPVALSRCYLLIAEVQKLKGKHDRAARYYEKAIRYAIMDRYIGKNHKHVFWLKARAKTCRRQNRDVSFLLPSLIRLALEIALTEIEIGGALAVGYFAISLADDVWELAETVRKR